MNDDSRESNDYCVAIIGMAGRFPGAGSVAEFWRNVRDGRESISRFSAAELEVADAAALAGRPGYVAARSVLEGVDQFDAAFFGILPREAELIDPQHRVFLECCWEALEDAGHDPQTYPGAVAVVAGCSANTYFLRNLCVDRRFIDEYTSAYQVGQYPTLLGTNHDFLATRVSYKLNLTGPSFTIQTGCSTSLVAVCQACQSLLSYQSDMALAGGVSITFPQKRGYLYTEGGMGSADGHCRTFDADARGTVFGSGAGVVVLKRLEDARADGDHVYAVIKGFAINNDGSAKVGYTAPSADGQAKVVASAQAAAGVHPESITYIEAHGTATPLGDPIEFAALTRAFREQTQAVGYCALGTAKMNVGHLDIAAGVTGLINAAQMLVHRQLPPAIHFKTANPNIDLAHSPFYVNTRLTPWERRDSPRRAGVSAFGVGGTNAHVIVEEAPPALPSPPPRAGHLLLFSARSARALDRTIENLAGHLKAHPEIDLGSVAFTLQAGRRGFEHRAALACTDLADAIRTLESRDSSRLSRQTDDGRGAGVVFMFPGQGAPRPDAGDELYRDEPHFRRDIETCSEILAPHLGFDLREALYPRGSRSGRSQALQETRLAQPALFVTEYALAKLWIRWGVQPRALIGHSVGEYVAACLAGVFTLEAALDIIAARGRMMQAMPPGEMLAVRLSESDVVPLLDGALDLAAVNGPGLSVVSGPATAIDRLQRELEQQRVGTRRLTTSHAFHSRMMDPFVAPFTDYLRRFPMGAPTIPLISGVTGNLVTADDARSPEYWARHARQPVRFADGVRALQSVAAGPFLEVGPGHVLSGLVRQQGDGSARAVAIPSLPEPAGGQAELVALLDAAGKLWLHGVTLAWPEVCGGRVQRCSLPTYPFERQRYWVDPPASESPPGAPVENGNGVDLTVPQLSPRPRCRMPEPKPREATVPPRRERLRAVLTEIVEEQSGLSLAGGDGAATFLEMGFDSLSLTQVSLALQAKFGVSIAIRQLLDQVSTLDALAAFLDARLPAEALPATPPEPPAGPAPMPTPTAAPPSAPALESIVRAQLELMSRQLDLLAGGAPSIEAPAAVAAPGAHANGKAHVEATAPKEEFKPFGPYKPVQRGTVGGLDDRQSRYLRALIARYCARTARSKEYTQAHRRTLADPRAAAGFRAQWKEMVYPIVTVRSRGSRLWDLDGNEYIDILNGFGPIMFGHAPEFITAALRAQLERGFEIGPQTTLAGEVADMVCALTGMERATFCNTGSEAVMAALRIARTVTARKQVVIFAGAYHGTFDEVLVKGIRRKGAEHSVPIAPGIPADHVANITVLNYGTPEALDYLRQHAGTLAAVVVEPVQSRHPALQPVEFLRELRQITAAAGTALVFDEVVTGFRVHPGGAQAVFGIRADMATYGKVVGGGMPIGILAGSARFMDALDGGHWQYGDDSYPETGVTFFAGTFVRHPLALAATRAVLAHLTQAGPRLQRDLNEKTGRLVGAINRVFESRGVPIRIEHFGSIFYFSVPAEQPFGSLLYYHLREKGVHIQEGFPCFLTTAHTDADIDHVARAFTEAVVEMQAGGVLPAAAAPDGDAGVGSAGLPAAVPLTEAQREVWVSARMGDEASCAFNEAFALHLRGALDRRALREAVQALVERHDALRGTIDADQESLRVLDSIPVVIPEVDLSSLSESERAVRIEELIRDDASRPFDLAGGPLFRATLVGLERDHHVLLFTAHHVVCDGWSTNVLLTELGQLYTAKRTGKASDLPVPTQFRAYARAQVDWVRSAERAAVEEWWCEQFATPVLPLELPVDRPRGPLKSYHGATARLTIGPEATDRIRRFGARQGCTLFATLLAGFTVLLHRLTGQDDLVVGIPTAGQTLLGGEGETLVGHCVNFLPIRSSVAGDASVGGFLAQVKKTLLDAYDHQNYTYGSLLRKLALPRDPSRLPLVEVQFNLERVGSGLAFAGIETEVDPSPKRFVNFDLFVNAVESKSGLTVDCDFNSDLFDIATVNRWLHHFATLLDAMASDPAQAVSTLPLLDDQERRRLVVEWNDTEVALPSGECVHHLIARQAARTPQAVAAVDLERQLTYAELEHEANQLAHFLQAGGVGPETPVAICMDRSLEMLIAVLGVMKAGGAYVPLDPEFPDERIASILKAANPPWLLTQERVAARINPQGARVLCVDSDRDAIARASRGEPAPGASESNLAYLIFTSGSTGRPKGVPVTHRSVVNLLRSMADQPGLAAGDTLCAVTTLSFDIAALELLLPLTVGARVVILPREVVRDGKRLLTQLSGSGATVLQGTPATWRLLLEAGWNGSPDLKVLCGGEAMSRELADALLARSSSVWNMYGPTETTIWSAAARVEPGSGPVPVGRPIANTEFYVLDRSGQPVPIGVPGELFIGGSGVARGYWNNPELTAEKFQQNPFRTDAEGRLFRTGDSVRYRPDGTLTFLGRLDSEVKVRGFRIDTSEVESALAENPAVRDCVVVAREDTPGEKRLTAYLVSDQRTVEPDELRRFLSAKLPEYMVPTLFVPIDAVPRTPNGKVNLRGLPPIDQMVARSGSAAAPPSTPLERTLARICTGVLNLDRLGVHDSLFDLGADSIHVFQIVTRANEAGLNLSLKQVLSGRTIAAICAGLAEPEDKMRNPDVPRLVPVSRSGYRTRVRTIS